MGQSTFNLSRFFNQLGIKNPKPTMLESVQPVVNVGEFGELTPMFRQPSMMVGFDIGAVAAQRAIFQIHALGQGGTLVHTVTSAGIIFFVTLQADLGLANQSSVCIFGNTRPASLVTAGTSVVNPFGTTSGRNSASSRPNFSIGNRPFFLDHGQILTCGVAGVNSALNNNNVWLTDLPTAALE